MAWDSLTVPGDALSVLTDDHRDIERLWEEATGGSDERTAQYRRIVRQISIHDSIEKDFLYPTIRDCVDDGEQFASRALEDHHDIDTHLKAAEEKGLDSPDAVSVLSEALRLLRQHVIYEETELFPALRAALGQAELDSLGEKISAARSSAPTHPHPAVAGDGFGARLSRVFEGAVDRATDSLRHRPEQ